MTDEQIREAAYFNWLNKGCPENADVECWLEAEGVCPCCGKKECECGPDCECRKNGPCACEEKKATKKRACKKTADPVEKKEKKTTKTTKKVAKK